jgi:hypothetical protein
LKDGGPFGRISNWRPSSGAELIGRARNEPPATIEDVGVDHRRTYVAMPHEFLNRTNVVAVFEKMRRERVSKGMTRHPPGDSRMVASLVHGALKDGFMKMMSPCPTGLWIFVRSRGGKDPLPFSRAPGCRDLARQSVGQLDIPTTAPKILSVLLPHLLEMNVECRHGAQMPRSHSPAHLSDQ